MPHYVLPASELAAWLRMRAKDNWWSVAGDPLLTGRRSFPCTGDELADQLDRINRPLLVATVGQDGGGGEIRAEQLDNLATRWDGAPHKGEKDQDRLFLFSWQDKDEDWMLIEDLRTTRRVQKDLMQEA
jgi:hypothetical protein